jgi:DNA invertase Pin-like site-specific DNA recombinase
MKTNVVIYSRVSTQIQEYRRQTEELLDLAQKSGFEVKNVFEEKISGMKKNEDRPKLKEMVEYVKTNNIKKVLCWEMSRLGRNTIEVLKTIELLNKNRVSLFIKNYNIETLDDKGNTNPLSQFMIQILTSVSEMERTTIKQRIKSGYENFRSHGGVVGRKPGFKKNNDALLLEHKDVVKLLKQEFSVRKVMKITDKSSGTIMKVKKLLHQDC